MKYKVLMHYPDGNDEEVEALFDSEDEALEGAEDASTCYDLGAEILNMSNPGDYPLDEDAECGFEIIEVDDE